MKRIIVVFLLAALLMPLIGCAEEQGRTMYVVVSENSRLNVRTKPDKHSEVAAALFNGDTILVFEVKGGWARTNSAGEWSEGWVSIDYLTSDPDFEPTSMCVKSNGRVRVRKTPGGEVARYIKNGQNVTVTLWNGNWAKIDGGWVDGAYLAEIEDGI